MNIDLSVESFLEKFLQVQAAVRVKIGKYHLISSIVACVLKFKRIVFLRLTVLPTHLAPLIAYPFAAMAPATHSTFLLLLGTIDNPHPILVPWVRFGLHSGKIVQNWAHWTGKCPPSETQRWNWTTVCFLLNLYRFGWSNRTKRAFSNIGTTRYFHGNE